MLFNSLDFLIFFPIVVSLYFACPYRYRWLLLLAASYYFYAAWKLEYLVLIILTTLVDYYAALQIVKTSLPAQRRKFLALSLSANLGLLFTFKYFNFVNDSLRALFDQFNIFYNVPAFELLLPVGISFYTFQSLSYIIDVYRGKLPPERHLGLFALFVSFFPQLVAGPIGRAGHLLPQFWLPHEFDPQRVTSGLRLMLWGMFKKVVIADRLAIYVDAVYNQPGDYQGWPLLLATYFFAFQIYGDFSGYSDIAIGAARVMGYDLMTNFRQPYLASSIADFWRRWHISLSTWFRDYLYIPLGGNRVVPWRWYFNLFIVFLISGLWHGANWTFAIWGSLHGLYLLLEIWIRQLTTRLTPTHHPAQPPTGPAATPGTGTSPESLTGHRSSVVGRYFPASLNWINTLLTFNLVCLAWIFFRANSLADAWLILQRLPDLSLGQDIIQPWAGQVADPGAELALSFSLILILILVDFLQAYRLLPRFFFAQPVWFRWAAYLLLALAIMNLGVTRGIPFIYFQF